MSTVRRIALLCGLAVLLPGSMISQTTPTLPQPIGSNAEGRAAVNRLVQVLGGSAKVHAVKTLRQTVTMVQRGQQTKIDQRIVYPNKQAQRLSLPQGELRLVVTPTAAFMVKGPQVRDLPPIQRASANAALKHDFINVLQHVNDPKYTFTATSNEMLDDLESTVVNVNADGTFTRWWISAEGKLLQERYSEIGQAGPTTQTMRYSDWKSFGGLQYPAKYEMLDEDGQPEFSMILVAMEVNDAVDPKLFDKPTQ